MVVVEFSMTPIGKGESVGKFVARAVKIVECSGLDYRLHAMGTLIEGEWDEVFGVVKKCFNALRKDCNRISVAIKVDYRKAKKGALRSKVASVERRLGHKVKTTG